MNAVLALPLVGLVCVHDELSVRRVIRDLSDVETSYGQCLRCSAWIVRTTWLGRDRETSIEDRDMTDAESDRLQAFEDQCRRNDQ